MGIKIKSNLGSVTIDAENLAGDQSLTIPSQASATLQTTSDAIASTRLTGALPVLDGSALTGVGVDGIVSTANATAITIDVNENVGIGTSSPGNTLDIKGDGSSTFGLTVSSPDDNEFVTIESYNDTHRMWFSATQDFQLGTATSKTGAAFSEKVRFPSSGGITFNGDTSSNNALDDYEEGTWTPVITASSGTINSYVIGGAYYTKIGRLCTINLYYYVTSNGTGSGYSKFTLPFTASNLAGYRATGGGNEIGHTGHGIIGTINAGATYGRIYMSKDGSYPINGGYNQITISYIPA